MFLVKPAVLCLLLYCLNVSAVWRVMWYPVLENLCMLCFSQPGGAATAPIEGLKHTFLWYIHYRTFNAAAPHVSHLPPL